MLIKIYDWLFTRKTWTKVSEQEFYTDRHELPVKRLWIMQDQFGNIKKKRIA